MHIAVEIELRQHQVEARVDLDTGRFLCCGTDALATDVFHAAGCPEGKAGDA
jgi:hypothetical protein